eukprot:TRINITY_DN1722_c0_g1_i1.p1 TRINITY_DN1722_c0_g1~~TRINITY_DN1722_c0_g1_i1.p1  ORF type:complete len:316 (+),score=56.06 TRINITY_DN1722_c0_g1_i1:112-1059(+)
MSSSSMAHVFGIVSLYEDRIPIFSPVLNSDKSSRQNFVCFRTPFASAVKAKHTKSSPNRVVNSSGLSSARHAICRMEFEGRVTGEDVRRSANPEHEVLQNNVNNGHAFLAGTMEVPGQEIRLGKNSEASSMISQDGEPLPAENEAKDGEETTYTVCILTGDVLEDPKDETVDAQEEIPLQLRWSAFAFCVLGIARLMDAVPGVFVDEGPAKYEELVTAISAIDPLLVGAIALSTTESLEGILRKDATTPDGIEQMRAHTISSLVDFFKKANTVILGLAFASFFKISIEVAAESELWALLWSQLQELVETVDWLAC